MDYTFFTSLSLALIGFCSVCLHSPIMMITILTLSQYHANQYYRLQWVVWANDVIHIIRTIAVTTKPVHKYNQSGEYRVPKSVTVESSPPSVPRPLLHPPHLHRIWLHPLVPRPLPSSPNSLSYPLHLPLGPVLVGQVVWAGEPPTPVCVCVWCGHGG